MNFIVPDIGLCIDSSEEFITDLVIENQGLFSKILMDIRKQTGGITGDVIISDRDKMLSIAKNAEVIWNPITIDINSQKIIKKLYQEMQEVSYELEEEILDVNCKIVCLLDSLSQKLPYSISYECDMDVTGILKAYKVQLEQDYDELTELFLNYIKMLHQICNISIFITINLKDYFNSNDIREIYKFCLYEKIIIINLGNSEKGCYTSEKRYIIDSDLCFIIPD